MGKFRLTAICFASLVALASGCETTPLCPPDRPCRPGGGTGGTGGGADAALGSDGAPSTVAGRVCLSDDVRFPLRCAVTGANGFTVQFGTSQALTAADGSFSLAVPAGALPTIVTASKQDFVESVVPFVASTATQTTIPTFAQATYLQFLNDNAFIFGADKGTVFAIVSNSRGTLAGATVVSDPTSVAIPRYAGSNPIQWETAATTASGLAALPGVTSGTIAIEVTPSGQPARRFVGIPTKASALTFVGLQLP